MSADSRAQAIDALLPQTQCTRCGYAACLPYAQAIAAGLADINRCAPGGAAGVARLAALLGRRDAPPLDPDCGHESARALARIDERRCIGCTLCLQACPVDAIVGAAKLMHTVIAQACTGCELCVPACPVDCIALQPLQAAPWSREQADAARARYRLRQQRHAAARTPVDTAIAQRAPGQATQEAKRAAIRTALARAQARLQARDAQ